MQIICAKNLLGALKAADGEYPSDIEMMQISQMIASIENQDKLKFKLNACFLRILYLKEKENMPQNQIYDLLVQQMHDTAQNDMLRQMILADFKDLIQLSLA